MKACGFEFETVHYGLVDGMPDGGEWSDEPDRAYWIDQATGLPCLLRRGPMSGAWCGYVAVPKSHRLYGHDYDYGLDLNVHGGLTYAAPCQEDDRDTGICTPNGTAWWFGFDCAHAWDMCPRYTLTRRRQLAENTYRTIAYARNQVEQLAQQLASIS